MSNDAQQLSSLECVQRLYEAARAVEFQVAGTPAGQLLVKALEACDAAIAEREVYAAQIEEADAIANALGDSDLVVDDYPVLSVAEGDGVWVSGAVWVPFPDEEDE